MPSDALYGPLRAQVRTSPTRERITRTYLKAHDSRGMIHLHFINFTTYGSQVNLRLRNLCSVPFSYPLGSNESQAGMLEVLGMPGSSKSCRYPRMVAEAWSPEELWAASLFPSGYKSQSHGCLVTHAPEVISPLYLFLDVCAI